MFTAYAVQQHTHLTLGLVGDRLDLRVADAAIAVAHPTTREANYPGAAAPHRQPRGEGYIVQRVEGAADVEDGHDLVPGQGVHSVCRGVG